MENIWSYSPSVCMDVCADARDSVGAYLLVERRTSRDDWPQLISRAGLVEKRAIHQPAHRD